MQTRNNTTTTATAPSSIARKCMMTLLLVCALSAIILPIGVHAAETRLELARRYLRMDSLADLKSSPIVIGSESDSRRTFIDSTGVVVTIDWREKNGVEEMLAQRYPGDRLNKFIWGSFGAGFGQVARM